jgi:broad specificity phosphatase PhoE
VWALTIAVDETDFGALESGLTRHLEPADKELSFELLRQVELTLPRVENLWEHLKARRGVTLAVSHGYLIRTLICKCVLQVPLDKLRRLQLSGCGVTIINCHGHTPRLLCLQRIGL